MKPYPIRKRADSRWKHNKRSHGVAQKDLKLSLQFIPAITKDYEFAITLKP